MLSQVSSPAMPYAEFLQAKSQSGAAAGFKPVWMPDFLFDFQASLVDWALWTGRAALFADCGLGKTPMELVWAENIVRITGGNVLIGAPLAVAWQIAQEAAKFGIEVHLSRDGTVHRGITVTNYERLHLFKPADFIAFVGDESSILGNVYIGTVAHNASSMRRRTGMGKGWRLMVGQRVNRYAAVINGKYLGSFPTIEAARAAYLEAAEKINAERGLT